MGWGHGYPKREGRGVAGWEDRFWGPRGQSIIWTTPWSVRHVHTEVAANQVTDELQ